MCAISEQDRVLGAVEGTSTPSGGVEGNRQWKRVKKYYLFNWLCTKMSYRKIRGMTTGGANNWRAVIY